MSKKALFLLIACWFAANVQAQFVYVTFGNRIPGVLDAPIYGLEESEVPFGDYANAKWGNTALGTPGGAQIYKGAAVEGWRVEFRAARGIHTNGLDSEFVNGSVTLTTGSGADAGYFPTTEVAFRMYASPGEYLTVQVRAWNPAFGTDWSKAFYGRLRAGASALLVTRVGEVATGLRSFSAGWLAPTLTPYNCPVPIHQLDFNYTPDVLFLKSSGHLYTSETPNGPYRLVPDSGPGYYYLISPRQSGKKMQFYRAGP
jgi:hypothetical protein